MKKFLMAVAFVVALMVWAPKSEAQTPYFGYGQGPYYGNGTYQRNWCAQHPAQCGSWRRETYRRHEMREHRRREVWRERRWREERRERERWERERWRRQHRRW